MSILVSKDAPSHSASDRQTPRVTWLSDSKIYPWADLWSKAPPPFILSVRKVWKQLQKYQFLASTTDGSSWILVAPRGSWWHPVNPGESPWIPWILMDPHTLFCIYMNYSGVVEQSQVSFFNLKKIDGSSWLQDLLFPPWLKLIVPYTDC